jgi:hypothetical protein
MRQPRRKFLNLPKFADGAPGLDLIVVSQHKMALAISYVPNPIF